MNGCLISIHAPVKGATWCPASASRPSSYFNPRSREGSDPRDPIAEYWRGISIHAPVKGATVGSAHPQDPHRISIHAPVKGATNVKGISDAAKKFQSTLP